MTDDQRLPLDVAAACLEALGNPTRLSVYRLLVQAGASGLSVGRIQKALTVPSSTLSHHITTLIRAGLVQQQRDGRVLICTADYTRMRAVLAFLTAECCEGVTTAAAAGEAAAE